MRVAVPLSLMLAVFAIIATPIPSDHLRSQPSPKAPKFVPGDACQSCHRAEHQAWQNSHHAWALKHAHSQSVLGDFNDRTFTLRGETTRFFRRDGQFFVTTAGPDGQSTDYQIRFTVGVEPLQQYLVEVAPGRLQALDIAWDTRRKTWFHIYPDQDAKPGDGLHWSGPYKNWNTRCAACHQTNYTKGYSAKDNTYRSQWSELAVSCGACHGPGEAHLAWAQNPQSFDRTTWANVDQRGLSVKFDEDRPSQELQVCAPCHSRRSPLGADSPLPGTAFADHYALALLRQHLYHADGQIDEEVYVYGSFLQSKMHARGVRCTNCHEPHSADLIAEGDAVCTQCHSPAGRPAFPSLPTANYNAASHHHHAPGSDAARCVSCHMPAKTYMQVDPRRDHSFRVPRPDLSVKLGTPNACTSCHQDKTPQWAAAQVRAWFPNGRTSTPHYAETLHAGRSKAGAATAGRLVRLALERSQPSIVRATALDLLRRSAHPQLVKDIAPLLKDPAPLVRAAALGVLQHSPTHLRIELATPLLTDPVKAVRLEAARVMIGIPRDRLPAEHRASAARAVAEYQQSLFTRQDFPETHMQIAGLAMVLRRFATAERALRQALEMDPQLADAWLTLARIQSALRRPRAARRTLMAAVQRIPNNGVIWLRLGAAHTAARQHRQAITALENSRKFMQLVPVHLDLLAVNHAAIGNTRAARGFADQLSGKFPQYRIQPALRRLLQPR